MMIIDIMQMAQSTASPRNKGLPAIIDAWHTNHFVTMPKTPQKNTVAIDLDIKNIHQKTGYRFNKNLEHTIS
jgi:hypothetical protein